MAGPAPACGVLDPAPTLRLLPGLPGTGDSAAVLHRASPLGFGARLGAALRRAARRPRSKRRSSRCRGHTRRHAACRSGRRRAAPRAPPRHSPPSLPLASQRWPRLPLRLVAAVSRVRRQPGALRPVKRVAAGTGPGSARSGSAQAVARRRIAAPALAGWCRASRPRVHPLGPAHAARAPARGAPARLRLRARRAPARRQKSP
mmetsp:Transcript_10572/g.38854  ORF Transcript_10572/g.38854 Transcript_10572/m.38854 type:complete len:203 (-) Transcript_10572:665-1273(-)|eukprot:scaffold1834_cov331-Prasinococcus_capsulatus_cf.AAC.8